MLFQRKYRKHEGRKMIIFDAFCKMNLIFMCNGENVITDKKNLNVAQSLHIQLLDCFFCIISSMCTYTHMHTNRQTHTLLWIKHGRQQAGLEKSVSSVDVYIQNQGKSSVSGCLDAAPPCSSAPRPGTDPPLTAKTIATHACTYTVYEMRMQHNLAVLRRSKHSLTKEWEMSHCSATGLGCHRDRPGYHETWSSKGVQGPNKQTLIVGGWTGVWVGEWGDDSKAKKKMCSKKWCERWRTWAGSNLVAAGSGRSALLQNRPKSLAGGDFQEMLLCVRVLTGPSLEPPTTQFKTGSKNALLCQARPQLSIRTRSQAQAHSWILHQFPPSLAQLWKTKPRHAPCMRGFWTLTFYSLPAL